MIFLDSDIFLIDLRYRRDQKYSANAGFLAQLQKSKETAVTSLFNVLEICGILSFNLNAQQLIDLYHHLPARYNLKIYPELKQRISLPRIPVKQILQVIQNKASFGDALIICIILEMGPVVSHLVSWNARHFVHHLPVPALTPAEALEAGIFRC
ncbi:MAG: hypothetical protein IMW93_07660 [Thermoanaerobacteraceae bacterium]|nr:hypothetical protein [Thermoanaerobacteraceae bacterium]